MRFVSFSALGEQGFGIAGAIGVVDLRRRLAVRSLRELLTRDLVAEAARFAGEVPDFPISALTLLPVIPDPAHFYCVGVNYQEHLDEVSDSGAPPYRVQHPSIFMRVPESITGAESALVLPRVSEQLDFEAELAIVIDSGTRMKIDGCWAR